MAGTWGPVVVLLAADAADQEEAPGWPWRAVALLLALDFGPLYLSRKISSMDTATGTRRPLVPLRAAELGPLCAAIAGSPSSRCARAPSYRSNLDGRVEAEWGVRDDLIVGSGVLGAFGGGKTGGAARVGTRARGPIAHLEAVVLVLVVDVCLDTVASGPMTCRGWGTSGEPSGFAPLHGELRRGRREEVRDRARRSPGWRAVRRTCRSPHRRRAPRSLPSASYQPSSPPASLHGRRLGAGERERCRTASKCI